MRIAAAGNVEVPAYLVIVAKGYDVSCENDFWTARKDEDSFGANGPIELLGLVAMARARGENRRATDEEIDSFLRKFSLD